MLKDNNGNWIVRYPCSSLSFCGEYVPEENYDELCDNIMHKMLKDNYNEYIEKFGDMLLYKLPK